jgi:hypothetical protein
MNQALKQKIRLGKIEVSKDQLGQMVEGAVVEIYGIDSLVIDRGVNIISLVSPSRTGREWLVRGDYDILYDSDGMSHLIPISVTEFNRQRDSFGDSCKYSLEFDVYKNKLKEAGVLE